MTKKSRYFLIGSAIALLLGLGGGLVAYLNHTRKAGLPPGVPDEVRYVPADAAVIGYANVRAVMRSDLRRELMPAIEMGSRKGRQMMNDFAGIDVEKEVDHVLGFVERVPAGGAPDPQWPHGTRIPNAMMLVQGNFQQSRVEQYIRDRGGVMQTHNGRSLSTHQHGKDEVAIGFVRPDLIAVGHAVLVRRALDLADSRSAAGSVPALTTNSELMNLVRDASDSTAWVVGHFDAVTRGMKLPGELSAHVPPVRFLSATADVNGGVKVAVRADTADQPAAEQLRDVVRGFLTLARLHGGGKPEFEGALKSIDLTTKDKTVQVTFAISPETVRSLAPRPRQ